MPPAHHRTLAVTAAAGALMFGATACEKPTPLVTAFSGSSVAQAHAQVWCHPGQEFEAGKCAGNPNAPAKVVRVAGNDSIGIDVDAELVEHGWYVATKDNRSDIQREHFYRLPLGLQTQGALNLRVVALDENNKPRGVWLFTVVPK